MHSLPKCFVAYPSAPASRAETIEQAIETVASGRVVQITGWKSLAAGGQPTVLVSSVSRGSANIGRENQAASSGVITLMSIQFNSAEEEALKVIAKKIDELRHFLSKYELPSDTSNLRGWYYFLNFTRSTLGNFNNDVSFVGTLLAKVYLVSRFPGLELNACAKSQSASGLDVDILTPDGKRIIGEVKTINPYKLNDFGAAQRDAFMKDFAKLLKVAASHKYLFLTEPRAFEVIQGKYRRQLAGVTVVCLADGNEIVT